MVCPFFYFIVKIFGVHFGVHILISFSLYNKSPSSTFLEELFFFMKLKFKLHQIHLIRHEFIRKMGVNTTNKAFRTIPHKAQLHSIGSLTLIYTRACLGIGIFLYTLSPSDVLCFAFKAIKKSVRALDLL